MHDRNADPASAALRPGPAGRAAARAGIAKLKAHPRFGFLFPYFQRARLEDANAFDINVAMVYPTTDPRSDAFEQHYDVVFTKYLLDEAPVAGLTVRAPAQSTCGAALVLGSQRRRPPAYTSSLPRPLIAPGLLFPTRLPGRAGAAAVGVRRDERRDVGAVPAGAGRHARRQLPRLGPQRVRLDAAQHDRAAGAHADRRHQGAAAVSWAVPHHWQGLSSQT